MDEKTLKRLLRADDGEKGSERCSGPFLPAAGRPLRPHSCADEGLLSAYVERGIPNEDRAKVEAHLADCEACLGQVAFLASQPVEPAGPIAPGAVARARDLAALAPGPWRLLVLRCGTALAGIACVVLVVVAVLRQGTAAQAPATTPVPNVTAGTPLPSAPEQPAAPQAAGREPSAEGVTPPAASLQPPAGAVKPSPPLDFARGGPERAPQSRAGRAGGPTTVRNSAPLAPTLSVVSPAENATLSRQDIEFRWHAVPGNLYYEIDLVTEDGTSVWHSRVEGTSARPPDGTKLDTGAKYFVWVKAFLSGGETVKSAAVPFHIAGQ